MATSQSKLALRKYRKENGLCIYCGAEALPGQTRCQKCADKGNEVLRKARVRAIAKGECANLGCHNKPAEGCKHCASCNHKSTKRSGEAWRRRVAAGVCGDCAEKPPQPGLTRCEACNQKLLKCNEQLRNKRATAGLCTTCGDPVLEAGYKKCRTCIDKRREVHARLKLEVLAAYGGPRCVGCSETEVAVLQVDHIAGGGHQHAKEIGGRGKMYLWLKKNGFPSGFRILCANCNVRAARGLKFPNDQ